MENDFMMYECFKKSAKGNNLYLLPIISVQNRLRVVMATTALLSVVSMTALSKLWSTMDHVMSSSPKALPPLSFF